MAYVTPSTVTAGDAVTAAAWNVITNDILQFAPFVQGVFTTEAARDAAITSPTEGMHAYITASTIAAATGTTTAVPTGIQTIYNGSVWVCVTPVGTRSSTNATTTSTSYVTTLTGDGTAMSVTLVTGTTATVMFASTGVNNNNYIFQSVSVSGATTLAASDDNGAQFYWFGSPAGISFGRTYVLTGLTAGTNTFTLNYKTNAGTATLEERGFIVQGIA